MKKLILSLLISSMISVMIAQVRYFDERYISTMANLNPVLVNPGATGMSDAHQVIVNYKNKWASFEDTPKTYLISYDGPVADRLGFGVLFMNDRNGSLQTSKVQGSLAYSIESLTNVISGGISGEYVKHGLDDGVLTHKQTDPDGIIDERALGNGFFDVSVGFQGVYDNKVTYGAAFPSLVSSRLDDNSNDMIDRELGFVLNVGYIYTKENLDATFEPSLLVKKLNYVPTHVDINLLGRFADDKFRGGVTYTLDGDKRVGFLLGMTFNAMGINYGYNVSRHEFQTYNNGSHEFSLRFDIGGKKRNKTMELPIMEKSMDDSVIETINK